MRPLTEPAGPPPADSETDSGVFDLATLVAPDPDGAAPRRRVSLAPIVPWAPVEPRPKSRTGLYLGLASALLFAVGGLSLAYAANRMAPLSDRQTAPAVLLPGSSSIHSVEAPAEVAASAVDAAPATGASGTSNGSSSPDAASTNDDAEAASRSAARAIGAARVTTRSSPRSVVPPAASSNDRGTSTSRYLPPEPAPEALDRSVEALLDAAIGGVSRPAVSPPPSGLPELPNRTAVRTVMDDLEEGIRACAPGTHGRAEARITVHGPSGAVRLARMGGDFATRPQRACMEQVLAGARFAPFERERFVISYPYRL